MWFRNLIVYRLRAPLDLDANALHASLVAQAFAPVAGLDEASAGWVPPCEGDERLAHPVGRQLVVQLRQERRLLPAKVIAQFVRQRVAQIEAEEGFKPGRKRMREIKEAVRDDLLPRAFSLATDTRAWLDASAGWLVVDAASANRADEVFALLVKAIDGFSGRRLAPLRQAVDAMTDWLSSDEAPAGFTIDQDALLKARDGKASVRYANQTMDSDEVARHIRSGKRCTRLALTWSDRVSFVLTDALEFKRVKPLDVLRDAADATEAGGDPVAQFDADATLMTGELGRLLADLVDALGGEPVSPSTANPAEPGPGPVAAATVVPPAAAQRRAA
jgi:recombination associated protein RdgC